MKKSKNELRLDAALVTEGLGAIELTNLRPAVDYEGHKVLKTVSLSEAFTLPQGWSPLAKLAHHLVIIKGTSVATFDGGVATVADAALPGAIKCQNKVGDRLLLMCDKGAAYVSIDGGMPVVTPARRDYPAISLYGVNDVEVSAHVDSRKLSKSYVIGLLEKKDSDALVADLAGAYRRLCADAAAQGVMVQPALVRYRLLDAVGDVLFESAPVLACHSEGAQCTSTMALYSPDRNSVNAYVLQANTWHLEAALPSMPDSGVAQAEVLMTPLFHPFDSKLQGDTFLNNASTSSEVFARVGLPGRENGLGTVWRINAQNAIMQAIARIEMLEQRVAVISDPFGGEARTVAVSVPVNPDPDVDTAKIKSAFARPVVPRTYAKVMLGRPHSFSATCAAVSSGAAAWGNLTVERFSGYHLPAFAASFGNEDWHSLCAVHFDGDEGVIRSDEGVDKAPTRLSPVLCYPAPDARELTIVASNSNINHKQTFALATDASGRFAVYIDPSLKPFSLPQCSPTVTVTATPGNIDFPDMLAFAPVGKPLDIVASATSESQILSVSGHIGSDQTWDFGRSRFTVGCRDAVYNAGVNLATLKTGLRTILKRGIDSGEALAVGPDGDVYVADGDGIIKLARGGGFCRFASGNGYVAVEYDDIRNELWALRVDGTADVFSSSSAYGRYGRTDVVSDRFVWLDGLHLVAGRKVFDVNGDDGQPRQVRLCLRGGTKARHGPIRPHSLIFKAQASLIRGTLTVSSSGVARLRPCFLRSAAINGALASPLPLSLPGRLVPAVEICLEAQVSSDFVFDSFVLCYD